jgi:23S rRNA (adenine2030-N6)-methyltransferase
MNYRHLYHAGNFADVLKHITLLFCAAYLQKKDRPVFFLDAHAGAGLYDLTSLEAGKTSEWQRGIGRIDAKASALPESLKRLYWDSVRHDFGKGRYPGSPLLLARLLRPQDRLIASELHPETFAALSGILKSNSKVRILRMDAYQTIRASLPPPERRGLVLVDPPFERKDEFTRLATEFKAWKKRFATGTYLVWYPLKAHLPVSWLKQAAIDAAFSRTWCVEAFVSPATQAGTLNGCGVMIFNAPFMVPEQIAALLPYLQSALDLYDFRPEWLVERI